MNTPSPTFLCPRCRAEFDNDSNYCGQCGAAMHGGEIDGEEPARDRRRNESDPWVGRVIDARYRVVEAIGAGGMGMVYKVEHQRMGKIAAMKVLHRELAADKEVVRRFRREAEAVSRLTHPNTVQVFDFGMADNALYLVMEYVRGRDLGTLIKRDGPMDLVKAAPLFCQVCNALAEAHEAGVVHRDLKPENVLVTRTHEGTDFAKVLDFGLAKLSEREDSAEATGGGAIIGTPFYMAPEQIRGEAIDGRTDIYALGGLLYRAVTGEHPFPGRSPVGVLTMHLTAELEPPSARRPDLAIDPAIDEIVLRAMSKRPEDRYANADELRLDLEAAYAEVTGSSMAAATSGIHRIRPGRSGERAAARSSARGFAIDAGDSDRPRLNRADFDAYERSLRRRQLARTAAIPIALAALAAGGWYFAHWRAGLPVAAEDEPNDAPGQADLIASGRAVDGQLGRRISKTEGDRDFYRLRERAAGAGRQVVSAHVTALPNLDLALSLYDDSGALLAHADAGGVGRGEHIRRLRVDRRLVVLVTESTTGRAGPPTENVSDSYRLTVELAALEPGAESEPNELDADALAIAAGAPIAGWLDRLGDVDAYRFSGAAGRYRVAISGAEEVPVLIRHGAAAPTAERTVELTLATGDLIRVELDDDANPARLGEHSEYRLAIDPAR